MLTHYEVLGKLKEPEENLDNLNKPLLRRLAMLGIAEGNQPAARRKFLHCTDSFARAQKLYMERR